MKHALNHLEWFDLIEKSGDREVIHTLLTNLNGYDTKHYAQPNLNADVKQLVNLFIALRLHQQKAQRHTLEAEIKAKS